MGPDVTTGHRVFVKFIGFKRSGSLVIKVLQTSKNLQQKMGNTAVMVGARGLEDLSSPCNWLLELRQVRRFFQLCVLTWKMGAGTGIRGRRLCNSTR